MFIGILYKVNTNEAAFLKIIKTLKLAFYHIYNTRAARLYLKQDRMLVRVF